MARCWSGCFLSVDLKQDDKTPTNPKCENSVQFIPNIDYIMRTKTDMIVKDIDSKLGRVVSPETFTVYNWVPVYRFLIGAVA